MPFSIELRVDVGTLASTLLEPKLRLNQYRLLDVGSAL